MGTCIIIYQYIYFSWVACVLKRILCFHDRPPDIKSSITYYFSNGTIYYVNYKLSLSFIKKFSLSLSLSYGTIRVEAMIFPESRYKSYYIIVERPPTRS